MLRHSWKTYKNVDNLLFAMLLWILSWTKCSLQKSKEHLLNPFRRKGPASSSLAMQLEDDFGFKVADDFKKKKKKATDVESVSSSVWEHIRSKRRDLGESGSRLHWETLLQRQWEMLWSARQNDQTATMREREIEKERERARERQIGEELYKTQQTHIATRKSCAK